MAVSKSRKSGKSKKRNNSSSGGFQTEILLLIVFAASIILLVSAFGLGGIVGNGISHFLFGTMGLLAFVFPVILFFGFAFFLSNRKNHLAYKKLFALLVFFIFLCGFIQLLTDGYMISSTLMDYYANSADYHTGGGIIGGAVCISTNSAFGVVGGYVIIILVLLVCMIIITQRSFFGFLNKIASAVTGVFKSGHDLYMEGQPERELKKEVRTKQRQQQRQERRAQRIKALEEELAAESDENDDELLEEMKDSSSKKKKVSVTAGFLAGTKLTKERPQEETEEEGNSSKAEDTLTIRDISHEDGQMEFQIQRQEPADVEEEPEEEWPDISSADLPEPEPFPEEQAVTEPVQPEPVHPEPMQPQPARSQRMSAGDVNGEIRNISREITSQAPVKRKYHYPPLKLLSRGDGKNQGDSDEYLRQTAQKLQETLRNFNVNVTVTNVSCGPTVTRYELQPEMGVKVSRIVALADDIKLNLATPDIRIEAPIPGKAAVGIEVPNKENSVVKLRDLIGSPEFKEARSKLAFAVGKDIAGKPVVTDIAKMPHLLISGATGSGKSVCINTLVISILYKASPDEVKLIMIDPKVVELSVYNGIPHLLIPVVTDPKKAAGALNWAVSEMSSRYNTFAEYGVRNLGEYNRKIENMQTAAGELQPEKMPQIIIIVDELADLMMVAAKEVEDAICRLAQLARAAGIHLIIATQRPSVNVITGLIKANMPSRIAFSVSSGVDSRTILDMNGAEKLLGKGDMLFYPQGYQKPERLQGALVTDEEVSAVVDFLSHKNPAAEYDTQIEQQVNTSVSPASGDSGDDRDIYFEEAGRFIIEKERASIGMLQRMFKIGFNRAARIMDQLCDAGVVGPEEGTKPRKVLMTMEEFNQYLEG